MPDLSPSQKRALELAVENGGALDLYSNGWKGRVDGLHSERVKASTVEALARKGLLILTAKDSMGNATKAVLKGGAGEPPAVQKSGRCTICKTEQEIVSETMNGQGLCARCIAYMNGDHLPPTRRCYGGQGKRWESAV